MISYVVFPAWWECWVLFMLIISILLPLFLASGTRPGPHLFQQLSLSPIPAWHVKRPLDVFNDWPVITQLLSSPNSRMLKNNWASGEENKISPAYQCLWSQRCVFVTPIESELCLLWLLQVDARPDAYLVLWEMAHSPHPSFLSVSLPSAHCTHWIPEE